ncbi:MAG: hypothetical protein ACK2TZ_02770 [Anaerolineales bacterium]
MRSLLHPVRIFNILWVAILLLSLVTRSGVDPANQMEQIRAHSRAYEFDYVSWTLSALARKGSQASLGVDRYLTVEEQRELVFDYLQLKNESIQLQSQLSSIIADPDQSDHQAREAEVREELDQKIAEREDLAPFAEQVLQSQLNHALVELDMSLGGQLIPPVLFRSEPDSYALIISPRDEIRQEANFMLVRGMSLDEIISLECSIEEELDLSALVVGIGGVGLYPSMVIESGNLDWLIHVIGHEWTHNFLTLRPLGMHYAASPELTTINETIADLSAEAIQRKTFELYYPEYLPDEEPAPVLQPAEPETGEDAVIQEPPPFDFRAEMHTTRLEADRLLAEGKIEEAEDYMEERRVFFWENGYQIRRLNQAYFAFHGSYAADPGGAASEEGVDLGQELRDLRSRASSYQEFMRLVAWRWRLEQFQALFE